MYVISNPSFLPFKSQRKIICSVAVDLPHYFMIQLLRSIFISCSKLKPYNTIISVHVLIVSYYVPTESFKNSPGRLKSAFGNTNFRYANCTVLVGGCLHVLWYHYQLIHVHVWPDQLHMTNQISQIHVVGLYKCT